jgi:Fe-Mn family superoxide dismutase
MLSDDWSQTRRGDRSRPPGGNFRRRGHATRKAIGLMRRIGLDDSGRCRSFAGTPAFFDFTLRTRPWHSPCPTFPIPYDALAPYMSRETLEFHHDKHHQAYVTAANNLAKGTEWENKPVEEVVKGTFGKNQTLFNNAAQHYNHSHFWKWMKKDGGGDKLPGSFEKQITSDIGPLAKVKEDLTQAGVTQFGSGWCWLAVKDGKIVTYEDAERGEPARPRRQAHPRLRRMGTFLLHRLS